jgi:hypothetical protein
MSKINAKLTPVLPSFAQHSCSIRSVEFTPQRARAASFETTACK